MPYIFLLINMHLVGTWNSSEPEIEREKWGRAPWWILVNLGGRKPIAASFFAKKKKRKKSKGNYLLRNYISTWYYSQCTVSQTRKKRKVGLPFYRSSEPLSRRNASWLHCTVWSEYWNQLSWRPKRCEARRLLWIVKSKAISYKPRASFCNAMPVNLPWSLYFLEIVVFATCIPFAMHACYWEPYECSSIGCIVQVATFD